MKRKTGTRQLLAALIAVICLACAAPVPAFASDVNIYSDKIQRGKTGKSMTVSFTVENISGADIDDLLIAFDTSGGEIWDESEEDREYGYAFPFEVTGTINDTDNPRSTGKLADGKDKRVSLTATVRRDLSEGYYKVPVVAMRRDGAWIGSEDLQIWITKSSTSSTDEDDENKTYDFVLGEGQSTPYGVYPEVMNFSIALRNNSPSNVYNIKASMILDADSEKFPFRINDVNYDRMFERIAVDETVSLDYSFAIRDDAYTGYYPISMKIYYSKSSTGEELETYETSFFVHVTNKDKDDNDAEFNEHDRTKARLVVDGFSVTPEKIIAGEAFDLALTVKNASGSVQASDILLSLESEKVSDSPVFTTDSGSSSVTVTSLGPGQSTQVNFRLVSRAGVDQRSYALTVKATYDSPEYKNAEDTMSVDIPVWQVARLGTGSMDVEPDTITVGEESNVMFGVNNLGRVTLYNVTVRFEADSIVPLESYVGNVKSGETGNVDCMLTGASPTADDGKVKVFISYEDENGTVSEVEKELMLTVMEPVDEMAGVDLAEETAEEIPERQGFFEKQKWALPAAAGLGAAAAVFGLSAVRRRRKKKEQEDADDAEL